MWSKITRRKRRERRRYDKGNRLFLYHNVMLAGYRRGGGLSVNVGEIGVPPIS